MRVAAPPPTIADRFAVNFATTALDGRRVAVDRAATEACAVVGARAVSIILRVARVRRRPRSIERSLDRIIVQPRRGPSRPREVRRTVRPHDVAPITGTRVR